MKHPRDKGRRGEKEVVAMYARAGWARACPSPMSGAMRPYGMGDLSPWPGDLAFVEPWMVEVKYDERVYKPGRGWVGEAFIRATIRELEKLWARHRDVVGARTPVPVLWARSNLKPWRVFVPEWALVRALGTWTVMTIGDNDWVEIDPDIYFDHVAVGEDWGPPNQ